MDPVGHGHVVGGELVLFWFEESRQSSSANSCKPMPDTVFTAKDLTKTYTSGEVEVRALQGVNLKVSARSWSCSGPPAAASPRC